MKNFFGVVLAAGIFWYPAVCNAQVQSGLPVSAIAKGIEQEAATGKPLNEAETICVVGSEHILAGDMLVFVDPIIEENRSRISPAQEPMVRQQLTRQLLRQYVEIKALYQEFFRDTAGTTAPAELKKAQSTVRNKANKIFYEKQVPNLLKSHGVTDLRALEEKLREKSMSVSSLKEQFVERVLAAEVERRHVPEEMEVSRDELIQYYQEHEEEWKKAGRARWRQLTARFDRFPSKEAARASIEKMGNEVYLGGKPFEAVAKESSHGFTSQEGGNFDWTTQGALKSKQLDQAIFSIPLRRLSQVIEDEIGFHIIEVLQREEASVVSFDDAHDKMRETIATAKKDALREAYHKKVMARTIIWTRWPEDIPGSRSLDEVLR